MEGTEPGLESAFEGGIGGGPLDLAGPELGFAFSGGERSRALKSDALGFLKRGKA